MNMSHRFLPEIVGFLKFAGFYPIDSVNKWLRSLLIFWRLILASTTIAYVSQAIIQLYFVEFVLAELSFSILNIGCYFFENIFLLFVVLIRSKFF